MLSVVNRDNKRQLLGIIANHKTGQVARYLPGTRP
jgi:hypothetical protein